MIDALVSLTRQMAREGVNPSDCVLTVPFDTFHELSKKFGENLGYDGPAVIAVGDLVEVQVRGLRIRPE